MLCTDCRKLRRNVNLRRRRGCKSLHGFEKSLSCCCCCCACVDGDIDVDDSSLNLSKNVLFLLDNVCFSDGVGTDDDDVVGDGILGIVIGFDFIRFVIIWKDCPVVVVVDDDDDIGPVGAVTVAGDDGEDDEEFGEGDKAK